jgi:hypothetical protein
MRTRLSVRRIPIMRMLPAVLAMTLCREGKGSVREKEREREREKERKRDRETERKRERETERKRSKRERDSTTLREK